MAALEKQGLLEKSSLLPVVRMPGVAGFNTMSKHSYPSDRLAENQVYEVVKAFDQNSSLRIFLRGNENFLLSGCTVVAQCRTK